MRKMIVIVGIVVGGVAAACGKYIYGRQKVANKCI